MMRILIVDDPPAGRGALLQIVGDEADPTGVCEAQDVRELFALARNQHCDVVVTDISLAGRSGLDVLKGLKQEHPKLPVLVLSISPEDQHGVRALKLGASGYMTMEGVPEELVQAIRRVVARGRHVSPSIRERLAADLATDTDRPPQAMLSKREHQVLCMLGCGQSVKEIAARLALSIKTISTYRTRILEKTGMKHNAELISYAIRHRLVDGPHPRP